MPTREELWHPWTFVDGEPHLPVEDDPLFGELIERLSKAFPEFPNLWKRTKAATKEYYMVAEQSYSITPALRAAYKKANDLGNQVKEYLTIAIEKGIENL